MPAGDLTAYLPQCRTCDPRVKLRILLDIAQAIRLVHAAKVVHADVKPGNLLLTYWRPIWNSLAATVKLHDFGAAREVMGTSAVPRGDPIYTAPEVNGGDPLTCAADVSSLASSRSRFGLAI